jgi:uncharacterized protein YjiS (DUF1127 family)
MQPDHATTFAALRNPAREAAASARERLGRFWDRIVERIMSHRSRLPPLPLEEHAEHALRDIGLTRANAPRWSESQRYSPYAAGWGLDMGTVTGAVRVPLATADGRAIRVSE